MKRKHINADALYDTVKSSFMKIPEYRTNLNNVQISMADATMSGLAIFALKYPSLLQFDRDSKDDIKSENIKNLFQIYNIPSDTQMRTIVDDVNPESIRPAFKRVFSHLQRGNELQKYQYLDGHYLIALDGTGIFSSTKIKCPHCIEHQSKSGEVSYHHQLLGASIVYPHVKQVIPLCPEPIMNQDGANKQDCERASAKRWLKKFRQDHPKLKTVIIEDALAANIPHLETLNEHNARYIIRIKEGAHKALFKQFRLNDEHNLTSEYEFSYNMGDRVKKKVTHKIKYINELTISNATTDMKVNFMSYTQTIDYVDPAQNKKNQEPLVTTFNWITDFKITKDNAAQIMWAGRARWKIENETFQTLKDETSYNLEHSYGHGKKHLSTNLAYLCVLAFLIDQSQEIGCSLFKKAMAVSHAKKVLWRDMKSYFTRVTFENWETFFKLITGDLGLILVDSS